jgi:hypothetical protein
MHAKSSCTRNIPRMRDIPMRMDPWKTWAIIPMPGAVDPMQGVIQWAVIHAMGIPCVAAVVVILEMADIHTMMARVKWKSSKI